MKKIIFDLETTGININDDRIVEIAILIIEDGISEEFYSLINPEIPIPIEASNVHGITNSVVDNAPTFKEISDKILSLFENVDEIITYNGIKFDIPLLQMEFNRIGLKLNLFGIKLIDSFIIEKEINKNTLENVYKKYTGNLLENAHSAMSDVKATFEVFEHQFNLIGENKINELVKIVDDETDIYNKFIKDDNKNLIWNFGKFKGEIVDKIKHCGYIDWFLSTDFPNESKEFLKRYL